MSCVVKLMPGSATKDNDDHLVLAWPAGPDDNEVMIGLHPEDVNFAETEITVDAEELRWLIATLQVALARIERRSTRLSEEEDSA